MFLTKNLKILISTGIAFDRSNTIISYSQSLITTEERINRFTAEIFSLFCLVNEIVVSNDEIFTLAFI